MVLSGIIVSYKKCSHCGSYSCLIASFPDKVSSMAELERLTRRTCSTCKSELSIKQLRAQAPMKAG